MSLKAISLILCLACAFVIASTHGQQKFGLSYIAEQMDQYCRISGGESAEQGPPVQTIRGKAGAPGRPGDRGPPGTVDYNRVDKMIEEKVKQILSITSCRNVSRTEAKTWNGTGGVFDIYLFGFPMEVYCDTTTDGGGWTVFQRRMDGSEDFDRTWAQYVHGFGNLNGEFWIGLEKLHKLTTSQNVELRVDIADWDGNSAYAHYSDFSVSDAASNYRLNIDGYSGTAGDSLKYHHANMMFSASDNDNDRNNGNCAQVHGGGWWFNSCDYSDLNGRYKIGGSYTGANDGVEWHHWKGTDLYSMKFSEMKIRPKM